jgi:hypothetical protein
LASLCLLLSRTGSSPAGKTPVLLLLLPLLSYSLVNDLSAAKACAALSFENTADLRDFLTDSDLVELIGIEPTTS